MGRYAPYAGHGDVSTIRLAQADDLPHVGLDTTGMAVAIDLGDPKAPAGDVHSRQKDPVAYRLALQAMHAAYAYQVFVARSCLKHILSALNCAI
eukprot:SAG31_NODE_4348_length_3325_cov_1.733416_3_plen_94_part_00